MRYERVYRSGPPRSDRGGVPLDYAAYHAYGGRYRGDKEYPRRDPYRGHGRSDRAGGGGGNYGGITDASYDRGYRGRTPRGQSGWVFGPGRGGDVGYRSTRIRGYDRW